MNILQQYDRLDILRILALAALYYVGARLGVTFATLGNIVTLIWPPTGIALAAVLIYGNRLWPGVALGAVASAVAGGYGGVFIVGQVAASLSEALLGAWLLRRIAGFDIGLVRLKDVVGLLFLAACFSTAIAAIIGTSSLIIAGKIPWTQFWSVGHIWWMGDAISVLVFTPLLLSLKAVPINWSRLREGEVAVLCAMFMAMSLTVFFGWMQDEITFHPKAFVLLPLIAWAALSFRLRGATLATFFVAIMALWSATNGLGDFAEDFKRLNILNYGLYILIIASTSLVLSGVYSSRARSEARLKEQLELYDSLIQAQSDIGEGVIMVEAGRVVYANEASCRISGYTQEEIRGLDSFLDLLHPGDHERVMRMHSRRLQGLPAETRYEALGIRRDGKPVNLELAVAVTRSESGVPRMTVAVLDITARKEAEARLKLVQHVFENTTEGILVTDADEIILEVNQGFEEITGYAREEVIGKTPQLLNSGQHDDAFFRTMRESIGQNGVWEGEIWNRRKSGEIYPEWLSIRAVKNDEGAVINYTAVFSDITLRKESEQRLNFLANHDALTKLPNRALLQERIDHALHIAQRNKTQIAILFIDLDRFKVINDTLGHHAGDLLLLECASRLQACLRESDTIARQGGDEFVVLLEDFGEGVQFLTAVARKVMAALTQSFVLLGQEVFISASIGISVFPQDGHDMGTLLKNADIAMYRAKEQGKNNFQFYASDSNVHSFERLALENSLRKALERDEFVLYYQPKVDLMTDSIVGAEALVRWVHADMGMVPPVQFIPLAEETGLIVQIGAWVLREACRQNSAWRRAGLPSITVAVNLSGGQFRDDKLPQTIASALSSSGLKPSGLELEITESMIMHNPERAVAILREFRDMGIQTSIDDFGTGYSSLGYIKRFPVNTLKVDRSFVQDVPGDADDTAITQAIIAMAHNLNLKVVAEGVETEEQLEFLRRQHCEQVQGYIYSKPLPADEFARLLGAGKFRIA